MMHAPRCDGAVLFAGLPPAIAEESHRLLCGRYDIERCTADEFSLLGGVELLRPDVVLSIFCTSAASRRSAASQQRNRSCLVLALTGMPLMSIREAVLAAGDTGVISRSEPATELAQWIDAVLSVRPYAPVSHLEPKQICGRIRSGHQSA